MRRFIAIFVAVAGGVAADRHRLVPRRPTLACCFRRPSWRPSRPIPTRSSLRPRPRSAPCRRMAARWRCDAGRSPTRARAAARAASSLTCTSAGQVEDTMLIDYDELDSLLDGLEYLGKLDWSVTPLPELRRGLYHQRRLPRCRLRQPANGQHRVRRAQHPGAHGAPGCYRATSWASCGAWSSRARPSSIPCAKRSSSRRSLLPARQPFSVGGRMCPSACRARCGPPSRQSHGGAQTSLGSSPAQTARAPTPPPRSSCCGAAGRESPG